jgi:hypothetical protein
MGAMYLLIRKPYWRINYGINLMLPLTYHSTIYETAWAKVVGGGLYTGTYAFKTYLVVCDVQARPSSHIAFKGVRYR